MGARVEIFDNPGQLGHALARHIADRLGTGDKPFVLGCPAGRTPRPTYWAFAQLAAEQQLDLSGLHIVMMDEFLRPGAAGYELCPEVAHYSCRGFGEREIRQAFNAGLSSERQIPRAHLHFPDPGSTVGYENEIEHLGGIDLFLLASGASDGHVAFNPPGTTLSQRTHVVALAEGTRADNLKTFPEFRGIAEVPTHGISVGPGTIVTWSRSAILILTGAHKAEAFRRIIGTGDYDSSWPATVIHACADAAIYAERPLSCQPNPPSSVLS